MNKVIFIIVIEGIYQGLHGIYNTYFDDIGEYGDVEDYREDANDMLYELVEDYLYNEDDEEKETAIENGEYHIFVFETEKTAEELRKTFDEGYGYDNFDEFVEKFGGKEVE